MTLDYFYGQAGELFSFFRIPKALFQEQRFQNLSTDAKILYGILLDRMSLSAKNGWRDEQGRVYIIYTVREVQESLCCAEHKAVKLFRELEDIDLVERKRRGLGRPSLIYVKDFSSGLPKAQVQNCQNSSSGAAEIAILEQPKPQANKTNKNNTEMSETKIYSFAHSVSTAFREKRYSMRSQFTSYEQLPITLTADHVAAALGISRANAYILLRSDGFPTLHIGKRMVVPKDRFLQWITDSVNG